MKQKSKSFRQQAFSDKRQPVDLLSLILLLTLFCALIPGWAQAEIRRLVLDYDDAHFQSPRGEGTTLYLKRALHAQYPRFNFSDLELQKVVVIAKTKKGMGDIRLRVGSVLSPPYRVYGSPAVFHSLHNKSFDRVSIHPPKKHSHGPWQLLLRGNFKVREVILTLDHPRHPTYFGWRPYGRYRH